MVYYDKNYSLFFIWPALTNNFAFYRSSRFHWESGNEEEDRKYEKISESKNTVKKMAQALNI